ncbi:MAG: hypothetical protein AAF790_02525 [Planctomycetota bacterium]
MASGDTLAVFDALASRPPSTGYPQIDLRNNHPVLDFDDTADEQTDFLALLPSGYAGGGLQVRLRWAATAATAGGVLWRASVERHAVGFDLDADGFGAASSVTVTAPASSGQVAEGLVAVASAAAGSPTAGESIRIRIARAATDAADTMTGDAELHSVEIREE